MSKASSGLLPNSRSGQTVAPTVGSFLRNYIKSMRLYYAFITGISGWLGLSFYQFLYPGRVEPGRSFLILLLLFLSWGINQIVNDYLGLAEDKINAPNRPMVTGALPARPALALSAAGLALTLLAAWRLNPLSIAPLVLGVLLNVVYEYAKGWSLWGNLVFGLMIAMCPVFGFLAAGPSPDPLFTSPRLAVLLLVAVANGVMTYYTYFKDMEGDRAAGKNTFVVRYGLKTACYAGVAASFICVLLCALLIRLDFLPLSGIVFKEEFFFLGLCTFFLQCWTGYSYCRHPSGPRTYFNLLTNIRACASANCALMAIFNAKAGLYLFIVSYILIGFFFSFYRDERA